MQEQEVGVIITPLGGNNSPQYQQEKGEDDDPCNAIMKTHTLTEKERERDNRRKEERKR